MQGQRKMLTTESVRLRIAVTTYQAHDFTGYFLIPLREGKIEFSSFADMVIQIDEILNEVEFPQCCVDMRSFSPIKPKKQERGIDPMAVEQYPVFTVQKSLANEHLFDLRVLYRRQASWQGEITSLRLNRRLSFRSAVELLYLIRSALPALPERS